MDSGGDVPEKDQLGEAIQEAQRKAILDQQWAAHQQLHETVEERDAKRADLRWDAHRELHKVAEQSVAKALEVTNRDRETHEESHDREHVLHAEKHASEQLAVQTALDAVGRERQIHAEAHEREHLQHQRIHDLAQIAVTKAEASVEERLKAMNEFRGQLRDQQATFVTRQTFDALAKEVDRRFVDMNAAMLQHFQSAEKLTQDRYETNRASITALEKSDVKGEGRSLGQGAAIAAIIAVITTTGALLGIVVLLANLATKGG